MRKDFYVYIYLDQRKIGTWSYKNLRFSFEPFYVGKGTKNRMGKHLHVDLLSQKNSKTSKIKAIMRDVGEEPIHFRIFENLTDKESTEIEIDMISHFGRKDNNTGILCNLTDGGEGQFNMSDVTRVKMSEAKRKSVFQYDLTGKFIRKWNSILDAENEFGRTIRNISTAIRRNGTCGGFIWKYDFCGQNIETRIKWQMPVKYTNVTSVDPLTKKVIAVYKSPKDAEKELNLKTGARNKICNAAKSNLKQKAYGFLWKIN